MSDRRQVWQTLSDLLQRLEKDVAARPAPDTSTSLDTTIVGSGMAGPSSDSLRSLENEIRKLGKAQFKANTLTESQLARWQETLASLQTAQAQDGEKVEKLIQERVAAARHELLEASLPALDGLENAIASGRRYLEKRDRAAQAARSPTQTALVSPADRAMLAAWLDGLRLVRDRLLAILQAGDVTPIPTVGRPFDPFLHKAVGVTTQGEGTPGTIVSEERRGYQSPAGVLRYAEVVVYRPEEKRGIRD